MYKRALFEGRGNLTFDVQTFDWESENGLTLCWVWNCVAEREGFEPPLPVRVNLISSQAPSAGLGHLSASYNPFSLSQETEEL